MATDAKKINKKKWGKITTRLSIFAFGKADEMNHFLLNLIL